MTYQGPQKYPGASTTKWYQGIYGGDRMEVNVCCLHTTEGFGLPAYDGGAMAPNLTAVADFGAKRLRWYQHFDIDRSSRALQNLSGGVETNTLNVVQVELDGTCDYTKRSKWGTKTAGKDYIYWGDPPDWALRDLAEFLRWLNANHGVPLVGPSTWLTYGPDTRRPGITPASYGASPARMSFSEWNAFRGICGHEHVPENVHGDPGSLPFAQLIALAKGTTTPPQEDDDMALTDAQAKQLAEIHAATTGINSLTEKDANGKPVPHGIGYYGAHTHRHGLMILAAETAQTAAITKLAGLVGSGVDTAAVVSAVQQAIEDAVVKVNVEVTSEPDAPTSA